MKTTRLLACAPLFLTSACASLLPGYKPPAGSILLTQVSPQKMAACIAQGANTSATSMQQGSFSIDVPEQSGTARLLVASDKVQTSVVLANDIPGKTRAMQIATACALKLSPPSVPSSMSAEPSA